MKRVTLQIAAAADVLLRVIAPSPATFKLTLVSKTNALLNLQVKLPSGAVLQTVSLGANATTVVDLDPVTQFELITTSGSGQLQVITWADGEFTHAVKRIEDAHEAEFLDYKFLESSSSSQNSSSSSSSSSSSTSSINSSSSSPSSNSSSSSSTSLSSASSASSASSSSSSSPSSRSSNSSSSSSQNSSSSSSSNSSSSVVAHL